MSIFSGIESASSGKGGKWLLPGSHLFKVEALKQPDNLRSGDCFIAELLVVESSNEDYSPGDRVSWIRNITKHKEMALGDIKAMIAATAGIDEDDIDVAGAEEATGPSQPFAGALVRCEAFNRETRAGGEFTRTNWSPAGAEAAA